MDLGFSKHVCVGLCSNWACVSPDRLRGYQRESSGQTKPGGSVAGRFTSAGATPPFSPGRGHCPRLSPVSSSSSVPVPVHFSPHSPLLLLLLSISTCLYGAARRSTYPSSAKPSTLLSTKTVARLSPRVFTTSLESRTQGASVGTSRSHQFVNKHKNI